jgi:ABC-type transport system involved in cytochrome c biogenesis ATPase subunit
MTPKPTADEARLGEIRNLANAANSGHSVKAPLAMLELRTEVLWLLDQLTAALARAEAAEKALEDIARLTAPEGGLPILAVHDIARRAARALSAAGGQ